MPQRNPRRSRQAALGEVAEAELAVYEHDSDAADEVASELREGVREMVTFQLEPETVWKLQWSTAGYPTLAEISLLSEDALFSLMGNSQRRGLLEDESTQTAVERGDGIFPAIRMKKARVGLATVEELAAVFDQCVGPACLEAFARAGYQAAWRTVLTWGIAHEAVGKLLPMRKQTLKGLTQELLMVGFSAGTVKRIWCSIEDRHRRYEHPLPFGGAGDFRRLFKAVAAVKGTPSKLLYRHPPHAKLAGIGRPHGLPGAERTGVRLGVVLVCRVVEVGDLQIYDLLWGHDADYHEMYLGTLAVRICRMKQDPERVGHYPRAGLATRAEWDVVGRLKRYAATQGLEVHEQCNKAELPGARCRFCPPFFKFALQVGSQRGERLPMSRQQVTNAVKQSLQLIGVSPEHYSGCSMLRGGVSAALTAQIQAPVLYLQSGHGSKNSAQSYMVPQDPSVWYEHFAALDL